MHLVYEHMLAPSLLITSASACLEVVPSERGGNRFCVQWRLHWNEYGLSEGKALFDADDLNAAFGLSETTGVSGDLLIQEYGADSAEPGKYIRYREYLNIPGPGRGLEQETNVSLLITFGIQNAVARVLMSTVKNL